MKYHFCIFCITFMNWLKKIFIPAFCRMLKVQKNKIVFYERFKCGYDCNPKYIAEEILKRNVSCKIIWITGNKKALKAKFPKKIKIVYHRNLLSVLYHLSTASVWVTNFDFNHFFAWGQPKKAEQFYINTWHGSLGIKKVKTFIDKNKNPHIIKEIKSCFNLVDAFISNSDFETFIYKEAFLYDKTVYKYGHPRNDIFFLQNKSINKEIEDKVRNYAKIPEGKSIVLYAPSFRDDGRFDCFNMNYDILIESLNNKFKKDFVLALRLHPNMLENKKMFLENSKKVFNYTNFDDMQELLFVSDILITDYSSCIFDFMLSRKPAFIYASDIEKYNNERGFFYPLEATPFPVICNNNEINEKISNFDFENYIQNVEIFLKDKGCIEDGLASKRVVDLIGSHIKNLGYVI